MSRLFLTAIALTIGSTFAFSANSIKLHSEVINGYLVPTIVVNGRTAMTIQDRGPKGRFESNFERAEHVYSILVDLEKKGMDLHKLRVRRYKSEYTANVDRTRVFAITNGDTVANQTTAYRLARDWVQNIKEALHPSGGERIAGVDVPDPDSIADLLSGEWVDPKEDQRSLYPLVFLLNLFSGSNWIIIVLQILFLIVIQSVITFGMLKYLNKKQLLTEHALQIRMDKLQDTLLNIRREFKLLEKDLAVQKKRAKPLVSSK
ncbi:hypothetical protein HOH87_05185 [bacterium]|nr:hypothetical protein [bacterium]